jgi:hypothetical protein
VVLVLFYRILHILGEQEFIFEVFEGISKKEGAHFLKTAQQTK